MSENNLKRRLTPMDAFFLYAETETAPMSVGATLIFEGKVPFVRFKNHIASRLHLVPRYRQRVVPAPFNISNPTWEDDPEFDIDNHIFRAKLEKPGTEAQLQQLKGELFTGMLDRGKPLWEMHVVEGLSGNRSAVIIKVHHAMVDGIAGISLAYLFLDLTPEIPKRTRNPRFNPNPLPDMKARLQDALWDNVVDNVVHWLRFGNNVKEFAGHFGFEELRRAIKKFALTIGGFLLPLTRMPFNKPFSGERLHVWREYAYSNARAVRAMCGGTLNDVVLTVLAAAMRKYVENQTDEEMSKCQSLRVLVPVNVRRERERSALGNRISFLPVEIPLGIDDPIELLHAVHERMRELKDAHVAESVSLMFDALQGSPAPLQSLLLGTVSNPIAQRILGQTVDVPPANLICTNVPGPQIPLYALGHRMLAMYAVVPTCLGMGVNCAVVSYDQKLFVSFVGDAQAGGAAVAEIMECFDQKFKELLDAADVKGAKYIEITRGGRREASPREAANRKGAGGNGRHHDAVREDGVRDVVPAVEEAPQEVVRREPLPEEAMVQEVFALVEAPKSEPAEEVRVEAPVQGPLEREPVSSEAPERQRDPGEIVQVGFLRREAHQGYSIPREAAQPDAWNAWQKRITARASSWPQYPAASALDEIDEKSAELTAASSCR